MSILPNETTSSPVWTFIKRSPILTSLVSYVGLNVASIILTFGFSDLTLLANAFPAIAIFFLSSAWNEDRKRNEQTPAKTRKNFLA